MGWIHENCHCFGFFFPLCKGKERNALFWDSLLRKWSSLRLCSLCHLSKPLHHWRAGELQKKETLTSASSEKKRHCRFYLRAADWQISAHFLAAQAGLGPTQDCLLPFGEGRTGTSSAPCRVWGCQAAGTQDSLSGSQVTKCLVLSERLDF